MAISGGEDFVNRVKELQGKSTINSDNLGKLDDIVIDKNKKSNKNLILIITSLVAVFIITILVLKFISNDTKKQELLIQEQTIDNELNFEEDSPKQVEKRLDINKIEQKEIPIKEETKPKKEVIKKDPLDITKEEDFQKEIPKKEETKPILNSKKEIKPIQVKETTLEKPKQNKKQNITKQTVNKPKGYFIQVGAFTKGVSKNLINTIKKYKLPFTTYKMKIKGRYFTKVLIGPYKTKNDALDDLTMVRKVVKNPKAYILRFK